MQLSTTAGTGQKPSEPPGRYGEGRGKGRRPFGWVKVSFKIDCIDYCKICMEINIKITEINEV